MPDPTGEGRTRPKTASWRLQNDELAAIVQRLFGRFEQADNAQAGLAVVGGCRPLENAIHEVAKLQRQCFGRLDLWGPHVARPVADEQIVDALAVGDLHALVVDP